MPYDIFVSHASEDKDEVVRPLVECLRALGLTIWLDEFELALGDSLRRSIDKGLAQSKYGVVVLSPAFLSKEWPQKELDALAAREDGGGKVILPIWHKLTQADVAKYSPLLADRLAVSTSKGLPYVADRICHAVRRGDVVAATVDVGRTLPPSIEPRRNHVATPKRSRWSIAAIGLLAMITVATSMYLWRLAERPAFVGTIAYSGDATSIAFSANGEWMATGGGNNHTTLLWNARTGNQVRLFAGNSVVSSVAFSPDGKRLATDSDLFDVDSGERIARLSGGYDVAFSPDGKLVATASGYQPSLGTKLFDRNTGSLIRVISDEYAKSLAFSHDGKVVATATGYLGKGVRLWNLENYNLVTTLEGPSEQVAFSPDGRYIACAGNGTVRLFRPFTGERLRDISGDIVAFSPDGRMLATVGEDKRVRLYDPATGNPIRTLNNVFATKLAFSADGERVGTITPDGKVVISSIH